MALLKGPVLTAVIVGLLSFALYEYAAQIERGETPRATGRRAGVKMMLAGLAGVVGTKGSLAIGALAELGVVAWGVQMVRSGATSDD